MFDAVKKLQFEKAALLRDQVSFLKDGRNPGKKPISKSKRYGRKKGIKRLILVIFLFYGQKHFHQC